MKRLLLALGFLLAAALPSFGQTSVPQASIVPSTGAYTAGYCLGNASASAILAIPGFTIPSGTGGTLLVDITVVDNSGQDAQIDFLFFSKAPTGTYTDAAACHLSTNDTPYLIGKVSVSGYTAYGTPGIATITGIPLALTNLPNGYPSGGKIWVVPVVQGTPTYGTTALYFNFGVIADGASQ